MNDKIKKIKPNIYQGEALPFAKLDKDSFENFSYSVLSEIGINHNFTVASGRNNSGDDGFDVVGKRKSDNLIVCIQCKRYSATLYNSTIAEELAKVALRSKLENSIVQEHYFLTIGEVSTKVRSAQRELDKKTFINLSKEKIYSDNFKTLIEKCKNKNIDPELTVKEYITNLDKLVIWSGVDLDQEIGRVWSKLTDTIERYFSLDILIREHPRPDFSIQNYLDEKIDMYDEFIELIATPNPLPFNLFKHNASDPLARHRKEEESGKNLKDVLDLSEILSNTPLGKSIVLTGSGGSGKSSSLLKLRSYQKKQYLTGADVAIPVLLNLNKYKGSIKDIVHESLGLKYGHWESIPSSFILLCDGLDEIPSLNAQDFLNELDILSKKGKISSIITIRESGLRNQVYFESIHECFKLSPLSYRQCFQLAQKVMPKKKQYLEFLKEFRSKVRILGNELLALPFGYTAAIKYYIDNNKLPVNSQDLIEDIFTRRIKHNKTRLKDLPEELQGIPESTLRKFAEILSFEFRIIHQKSSVTIEESLIIVKSSLKKLKEKNVFGAESLTDLNCLKLITHFELLNYLPDGTVTSGHDILADYLASSLLAKSWREHLHHLKSTLAQEAWAYASIHVEKMELKDFLEKIFEIDIILGAMAAKNRGSEAFHIAEKYIFIEDSKSSKVKFSRASTAMSVLGTNSCIAKLNENLNSEDENKKYHAMRALSIIGDEAMLEYCLKNNEPFVASGIKVSGGNSDMWLSGPPVNRTNIARKRISESHIKNDECIVLSLRTLVIFGDFSDLPEIEKVIMWTQNLSTYYAAMEALFSIDKKHAVEFTKNLLKHPANIPSIYVVETLSHFGEDIDTSVILKEFVGIKDVEDEMQITTMKRAVNLLSKHPLPANGPELLRKFYTDSDHNQKSNLWLIAKAHSLKEFDDLFWEILENDKKFELGQAVNYGIVFLKEEKDIARFISLSKCLLNSLIEDVVERSWDLQRVLEFLLSQNEKEVVADAVTKIFNKFLLSHFESRRVRREAAFNRVEVNRDDVKMSFFVDFELLGFLVHASKCSEFLTIELRKMFISIDVTMTNDDIKNAQVMLLSEIDPRVLDVEIELIQDPYDKFSLLGRISGLPTTDARLNTIASLLPIVILSHLSYSSIRKILSNCWCDSIATALIDAVANADWPVEYGTQLFNDVEHEASYLFNKQQAENQIAQKLVEVKNPVAKEILQCWYDYAKLNRD